MWIQTNSNERLINLDHISSIAVNNLDDKKYGIEVIIPHNNEKSYIAIYDTKEEAENLIHAIEQKLRDERNFIALF